MAYVVKEIKQDKVNYAEDISTADNKPDSKAQTKVGVGTLYVYDENLYVQKKSFTGGYNNISTNPAESDYWTYLGKIQD